MITGPTISSIMQSPALSRPSLELYQGQIVRGEIVKLLPDQTALVQIGQLRVLAQMETNLTVGQPAWMQVQRVGQPALLKVLSIGDKALKGESSFHDLTHALSIEDTEENHKIIDRLIQEKLPVNSNDVDQIREWLQKGVGSLDTVVLAMKKGFPLSEEVVSSLEQFFNGFQNESIGELTSTLQKIDSGSEWNQAISQFTMLLEKMKNSDIWFSGDKIQELLKLMDQMKIDIERVQSLKHSQENGEKLDKLVRFITGQQLMLSPSASPIEQWLIHLPIVEKNNSFVQIESQKQADGKIDSDNCRLLFYLDLVVLGNMVIDVSIVNKIVTIGIKNSHPEIEALSHLFRDGLKQSFKDTGYTLSGLKIEAGSEDRNKTPQSRLSPYKGVDFRI